MQKRRISISRNLLILHFTVMIWGFTGILGILITINAVQLVWYRVAIASLTLWCYFLISKTKFIVSKKQFLKFFFTGGLVAVHWILFFHAIKISNVSIGLISLSSMTPITGIIEPLFKKQKIYAGDIIVSLLIIIGIALIFKYQSNYTLGMITGLAGAVCAALFSTVNSQYVVQTNPSVICFYELSSAFFWTSIYRLTDGSLLNMPFNLTNSDWIYVGLLGTVCTAFAFVAGVGVMRTLSAFKVALVSNLEPLYGIVLAFLIFGKKEHMTGGFYIGSILILSAIFLYPIYKKRKNRS